MARTWASLPRSSTSLTRSGYVFRFYTNFNAPNAAHFTPSFSLYVWFFPQVLVDGPQSVTGIHRQVVPLKCISLTDVVVAKLPRNSTQKNLVKAWTEQSTLATWQKTAWAKKLDSKAKRAALTDFDRFKLMVAKKQKAKLIAEKLAK